MDAVLRKRYPHDHTASLAKEMALRIEQIYARAARLGLCKTPEYLASPDACRLRRGSEVGKGHRFKKGQSSWNKGISYQPGGRAMETQFKSGHRPQTWKPVGSLRITRDGTLQRKISDAKGNNSKRWRGVHELVWIDAHGPVPPGHIVVFKPGMRTAIADEITLDRVECISLAENMRRNTMYRYPQEIVQAIKLKGAVTRVINKHERREG